MGSKGEFEARYDNRRLSHDYDGSMTDGMCFKVLDTQMYWSS